MDKLSKSREEICKDCMFGIALENCRACLYNLFQEMDKHPPFTGEETIYISNQESHADGMGTLLKGGREKK